MELGKEEQRNEGRLALPLRKDRRWVWVKRPKGLGVWEGGDGARWDEMEGIREMPGMSKQLMGEDGGLVGRVGGWFDFGLIIGW